MLAAALNFQEEIWKSFVGALATAVFITAAGYFAADRWGKRRREEQEKFELRTALAERATKVAADMYVACQHTRRILATPVPADDTPEAQRREALAELDRQRAEALAELDKTYRAFSVESQALETLLGARFGVQWSAPTADNCLPGRAFLRWHQIRTKENARRYPPNL